MKFQMLKQMTYLKFKCTTYLFKIVFKSLNKTLPLDHNLNNNKNFKILKYFVSNKIAI